MPSRPRWTASGPASRSSSIRSPRLCRSNRSRRPGEVGVGWTIRDDYFDPALPGAVVLEYRLSGAVTWQFVPIAPGTPGLLEPQGQYARRGPPQGARPGRQCRRGAHHRQPRRRRPGLAAAGPRRLSAAGQPAAGRRPAKARRQGTALRQHQTRRAQLRAEGVRPIRCFPGGTVVYPRCPQLEPRTRIQGPPRRRARQAGHHLQRRHRGRLWPNPARTLRRRPGRSSPASGR